MLHVVCLLLLLLTPTAASPSVVVYGSTPAGVMAAVAAARMGARVTLLDPSVRVGGMCSNGLGHTDVGLSEAIGGLAAEFFLRNAHVYNASAAAPQYFLEPHVAEQVFNSMLAECGRNLTRVPLTAGTGVAAVHFNGSTVTGVTTGDGRSFAGDVFIDASYEGDLVVRGGTHLPIVNVSAAASGNARQAAGPAALLFTVGRESRAAYNESWAGRGEPFGNPFDMRPLPPFPSAASNALSPMLTVRISAPLGAADDGVQAYNFRLCAVLGNASGNARVVPRPRSYNASDWLLLREFAHLPAVEPAVASFLALGPLPNGKYDVNNACILSTDAVGLSAAYPLASDAARAAIVDAHVEYTRQYLYALQHDPGMPAAVRAAMADVFLCADEFASNGGWPDQLYIREAARMVGDVVFTQSMAWGPTPLPPALTVGLASYPADGHYVHRGPCVMHGANTTAGRCVMVTSEADLQAARANGSLWVGGEGYVGATNKPAVYPVPYVVLLPARAGARNLLSPTALSASHVTFASLRVEPTFMVLGHAAGVAAVLAARGGVAVHDVDLAVLQSTLRQQGAALGAAFEQ